MFDQIGDKAGGFSPHPTCTPCGVSTASSTVCIPDSLLSYKSSGTRGYVKETMLLRTTAAAEAAGSDSLMAICEGTLASACTALHGDKARSVDRAGGQCRLSGGDSVFAAFPDVGSVPPSRENESRENESSENESSEVGDIVQARIIPDLDGALLTFCSFDPGEKGVTIAASGSIPCVGPPPPPVVHGFLCEPPAPRRKRESHDREEDEVESKLGAKRQKSEETNISLGFSSPAVSSVSRHFQIGPNLDPALDESTDELQMLCDDFGFEMPDQPWSSCSKEGGEDSFPESSGSARQSRRQKIKATVQLLREAIPGGDCMDTSIVLDEAIHYVKLLQLQVQTLGAKRLASS